MTGNVFFSRRSIFNPSHQTNPSDTERTLPFSDKISAVWSSLKNACIVTTKFSQFQSNGIFLKQMRMWFLFRLSECEKPLPLLKPNSSLGTCTAVLEVGSWAPRPAAGGQLSCLAQLCQLTSAEHPTWSLAKALSWPLCFVFLYPAATVRVRDNSDDESNGCHREIRAWWRGQMSSTRVSEVFTITHFPYRASLIQICIKG